MRWLSAVLASGLASSTQASPPRSGHGIKALAFDAFPVFDPRPLFRRAAMAVDERGEELVQAWQSRLFQYQWLHALAGRYVDFEQAAAEALTFAARSTRLDLPSSTRAELIDGLLQLKAWPDVPQALASLRAAGLRLAFVSNATTRMLEAGIASSGLDGLFEHVLSTDRIRTYKPDPRAYGMAVDAFGLPAHEILFVAFAGWDVAGAKWFGYPTYQVNRLDQPAEALGVEADGEGRSMADLLAYVGDSRGRR